MKDPETVFREAVQHIRWDGTTLDHLSHESLLVCGRLSLRELETLTDAYRQWIDATTYKPDGEEEGVKLSFSTDMSAIVLPTGKRVILTISDNIGPILEIESDAPMLLRPPNIVVNGQSYRVQRTLPFDLSWRNTE